MVDNFPHTGKIVDMFPFTGDINSTHSRHVETVALLSKIQNMENIDITINLEDVDLTEIEAKATYKEIRGYVQDKYGFNVSNLNIAQVKRKNGIIERLNYNLPKTSGNRVPNCPPEKVAAIEDALRFYKMI